MRSECLPFTLIPHTSRLFADYLSYAPPVRQFYPRNPDLKSWAADEASKLRYSPERRQRVAAILERQNEAWAATPETRKNLERLRAGAACVVTGQQVGLFGGPLFAIFKALSAIRFAADATAAGVDCVPVFWLATEDHDLAEINHATVLGPDNSLHVLTTTSHDVEDAPISRIRLSDDVDDLVAQATGLLGDSEATDLLREAYRRGETMGNAFARLFARLAGRWGVIMLDPSDAELHSISQPVYQAAIEQVEQLDDALLRRGGELTAAGYHEQVKVTPASTLLFAIQDGRRVVIHRGNGVNNHGEFRIGQQKISRNDLLARIASEPQNFSANVLLRPVVQDFLLPTIAYTGGPAETAYFAQAAVVYEALLGRVTPVLPRFSATLVEPKIQRLMERYQIGLKDLFHGPEKVRELLGERTLPADLNQAFHSAEQALAKSLAEIEKSLEKLDPTLVGAAQNAASKMHHQLTQLRARAARAELSRNEVLDRHAAQLNNVLYPRKDLQEREIAGITFLARHGLELMDSLYETTGNGCPDHQVIYL